MPKILIFIILLFYLSFPYSLLGQLDIPTNSFEATYKEKYLALHYRYDDERQVHNYSNNWDLDGDGIKDEVYFKGDGGAHLYYYLVIFLSFDKKVRIFPYLSTDFPFLNVENTSNYATNNNKKFNIGFHVFDYNKDGVMDILIHLDEKSFLFQNKSLETKGVYSSSIVVSFKKGLIQLKDISRFE
jgi:hypothetical protein